MAAGYIAVWLNLLGRGDGRTPGFLSGTGFEFLPIGPPDRIGSSLEITALLSFVHKSVTFLKHLVVSVQA